MSKREFRLDNEHRYNRKGPVRWILSHLARYPFFPLAALAAAILNNYVFSQVQFQIGRAFDLITSPGWQTSALLAIALTVLGIALVQGLTGLARNYSVEFIAQRIERDARDELYASLLGKSQSFHNSQRVGDIMARATNDVRMLNAMFSPGLMLILDSSMAIVVPIVLIGRMKPDLLLVPAIFLVLLILTVYDYNRRLKPVSFNIREQFGVLNAGLTEAISGIEVVKANVQEHYEWWKFTGNARKVRDLYVRQGEIQALYWPSLAFTLAWAGALLHGLLLWRAGGLTLGQAVTFLGLVGSLRFPTFISIFTFNLVQLGIASARRILETINTETELDENPQGVAQPIQGEVVFENVSFGYNGAPVLKDVSFTARPGETIAIVGQTGSGKTTLTRLINRIFDADGGRVLVDGVDVRDWSLESLRSQISAIEQDPFLFSRTVRENIAFGAPNATDEDIRTAAQAAQAHEFISEFRDGYQTEIGERGVTLSGGQRQRLAIARAFLTDPRILILDDSTSAIDSATEDQIQRAMRHISSQRTTFLITHRLSQIRWADRILVLRRGELVDQGSHEELLARSPDYCRIFAHCG
ncbi:MAG: putative multidrug export ATP-binding/permease protein [Chloroflexi bacterium ADurb.Bin325]|nr:MAG: putative multidrug export ATP-binding/permease protein [Chloroflexi bacterium ADurb.Bin325]